MDKTKIDWCDSTWNPITGCLHGCEYCYAMGIAKRFGKNYPDHSVHHFEHPDLHILDNRVEDTPYPFGFEPTFHAYRLDDYRNKKSRNIFVCSMADLFGAWVPDDWIEGVFSACINAPQHNYLFLTKNVERYCEYGVPTEANNLWYGTTITKEQEMSNFNYLPAHCKIFVSIEPILEDLKPENYNILFRQVDWVIIGAETGRRKNKVVPERKWIEEIVKQCKEFGTPVFMKSSLADVWGEPLIQEFPEELKNKTV